MDFFFQSDRTVNQLGSAFCVVDFVGFWKGAVIGFQFEKTICYIK